MAPSRSRKCVLPRSRSRSPSRSKSRTRAASKRKAPTKRSPSKRRGTSLPRRYASEPTPSDKYDGESEDDYDYQKRNYCYDKMTDEEKAERELTINAEIQIEQSRQERKQRQQNEHSMEKSFDSVADEVAIQINKSSHFLNKMTRATSKFFMKQEHDTPFCYGVRLFVGILLILTLLYIARTQSLSG